MPLMFHNSKLRIVTYNRSLNITKIENYTVPTRLTCLTFSGSELFENLFCILNLKMMYILR